MNRQAASPPIPMPAARIGRFSGADTFSTSVLPMLDFFCRASQTARACTSTLRHTNTNRRPRLFVFLIQLLIRVSRMVNMVAALWRYREAHAQLLAEAKAKAAATTASSPSRTENPEAVPWPRLFQEFKNQDVYNQVFVFLATAISIVLNIVAFLSPNYTGRIFDLLVAPDATMHAAWGLLFMRLQLDMLSWLGNVLVGILFALARWRTSTKCRVSLFNNIVRQEIEWFANLPTGHLNSELVHQPEYIQQILSKSISDLLVGVINLFGGLFMVFSVDWRLALLGICIRAPFIYRAAAQSARIVSLYSRVQNDAITSANALAAEAITNIHVLQVSRYSGFSLVLNEP